MQIDTTVQHIGRIYDYMLGGHHNYEVDRKAADQILKLIPAYPRWARLNRWFLQLVASTWAEEGQEQVLDLASGLPTQGHFNEYLTDARILFSDIDPVSVTYGQQMLEALPNARYVASDLRAPEGILADAREFFGDAPKLAVGAIGILYFLTDAEITALMAKLHAYCAPGSVMALTFIELPEGPGAAKMRASIARICTLAAAMTLLTSLCRPLRS